MVGVAYASVPLYDAVLQGDRLSAARRASPSATPARRGRPRHDGPLRRQRVARPRLALRAGAAARSRCSSARPSRVFYKLTNTGTHAVDRHRVLQRRAGADGRLFQQDPVLLLQRHHAAARREHGIAGRVLRRSRDRRGHGHQGVSTTITLSYTFFPSKAAASRWREMQGQRRAKLSVGKPTLRGPAADSAGVEDTESDHGRAHTKNHDYHLVDPSPWPLSAPSAPS